jgi:hypothetical protein
MRKRIVRFEVVSTTISLVIGLILHLTTHNWQLALAVVLVSEVLIHLSVFTLRYGPLLERMEEACPENEIHPLTAIREMRGNSIPVPLLLERSTEWLFQERFDEVIEKLRRELKDLSQQRYTVRMDDVLDLSLRVCEGISHSAFCTALDKHLPIFATVLGQKLKEANYSAAARLGTAGAFTRLFILQAKSSVNKFVYELMQENAAHGINVLVIERAKLLQSLRKEHRLNIGNADDQLDFGLWDNRYLMRITGTGSVRYLHVSAEKNDLEDARKVIALLRNEASSLQTFCSELREPINGPGGGWSTRPEKILNLPPPNGPHEEDAVRIFEAAKLSIPENGRLAILGLTHQLIDKARLLRKDERFRNIKIDAIDCREFHPPPEFDREIKFNHANWLDWTPQHPYHVVVGDDVLCNLAIWQVPMFFESMAKFVEPNALFIVRTTAIFSPDFIHPTKRDIATRLKHIRNAVEANGQNTSVDLLNESCIYEIAWPMMHSDGFYDKATATFDLGDWDRFINDEFGLDPVFANRLRLPYNVRVMSMDYGELKDMALPWFEVAQDEIEVHSIWEHPTYSSLPWAKETASTFRQYYRIIVFKKCA